MVEKTGDKNTAHYQPGSLVGCTSKFSELKWSKIHDGKSDLVHAFTSSLSTFVVFRYVSDIAMEPQLIRLYHFSILFTLEKKSDLIRSNCKYFKSVLECISEVPSKSSLH